MIQRRAALKAGKPPVRRTPLRAGGPLVSRTGLAPVSAKRAAALMAVGKPLAAAKRPRYTGPDRPTVEAVWARDSGRCALCGGEVTGRRGWDWSVHHRRPRRAGGDRRPDTNSAANLVLLHGHGRSSCHGEVEQQRIVAVAAGFLLHDGDDPARVAIVHAVHGRVRLVHLLAVTVGTALDDVERANHG